MSAIPIQTIRQQKVLLDADLATLYGVSTKVFNQAVKRNEARFPEDFRFQLSADEYESLLRSQTVTLKRGQHRKYLPYVFTEHGALQAANILRSEKAKEMSIYVVRAFVQMRRELAISQEVLKRLALIDKKLLEHDNVIEDLVQNLIPLLEEPPAPEKPAMGFHP
jgi:DNA-binding transcriptional regulator YiaG